MVELIVAGTIVVGAATIWNRRHPTASHGVTSAFMPVGLNDSDYDLPCPWCKAATTETDSHCPSCRQPFG